MDNEQNNHLKAYGVAFWEIKRGEDVEWLLNYRGGSFLMNLSPALERECKVRGVRAEGVNISTLSVILGTIENSNMDIVLLEKAPRIAVYTPPNKQPWDDAVTLALAYAEIPYTAVYDDDVLAGNLKKFDWLHLHHEDFTGQHGKFWGNFRNAKWYIQQTQAYQKLAEAANFKSVTAHKRAVALALKDYVVRGGFLFAMCSATDSWDITLAGQAVDIVDTPYDGTPPTSGVNGKLDFSKGVAFENYQLYTDPAIYEYSTIDIPPSHLPAPRVADSDYFTLFEFAAKYDPVPTMLTQNHVGVIKGFMGQTTNFNRQYIKRSVTIMGEREGTDEVRYIHGNLGRGTFTFLGGHDPEDYQHFVGDPPTNLELHPNSPGYRLILNNLLFPAARKKERKT
ncbi:asparagine synthetase B [Candidatus Neomarinimicrobiota bacterium]